MKHLSFILSLIFISSIIFALPTDEQIRQASSILEVPYDDLKSLVQFYQSSNSSSNAITVSAETLCSEYLANELAANSKYKDKMILLTGRVNEIKKDYRGYYARLKGISRDYVPYTIDTYFKDTELNRLANVSPGQIIKVLGICTGQSGFLSFIIIDAIFSN